MEVNGRDVQGYAVDKDQGSRIQRQSGSQSQNTLNTYSSRVWLMTSVASFSS